jgi:Cft2 family RNA processing exonuclease
MSNIRFQSLLRRPEIGANSYCLEFGATRLVLDSGMHPKEESLQAVPNFAELAQLRLDAILISHSHLDHVGSLPILQRQHPEADVVMTQPTSFLAEAMLHNSVNVMTHRRAQSGIREYPLFTHNEVERCARQWGARGVGRPFEIGTDNVRCTFYDAGHILGSVGMLFEHAGKRVFYTGDTHLQNQTLMQAAQFPTEPVDVLIMETTRGAKASTEGYTRDAEARRLAAAITETINRGGSVLMPVFAMGKSQEMLLLMHELKRKGLLANFPPMLFGGLATRMTQITDRFCDGGHRSHHGVRLLGLKDLVQPMERSKPQQKKRQLNYSPGKVYALSSGMMTENTASNDFAFQFIDGRKNSLLLVGYCDPDSPAGRILKAQPGDPILLNPDNAPVSLNCEVKQFDFSGHAPREELLAMAVRMQPKQILLVHGDAPATAWFQEELQKLLPDTQVTIPTPGEIIPLA